MSCKDPHVAFEEKNKAQRRTHFNQSYTHTSTNPCIHINTNTFIDCVSNV